MQALLLDAPGHPEDLRIGDLPDPTPGPGEVRIRVAACGLNPVDAKLLQGGHPDWSWPHVPGLDVVGVVDCLGPGASRFSVGQLVAGHGDLRTNGALADYTTICEQVLAAVPEGIPPTVAAALPCAGMTAYQAVIDRLRLTSGDSVLITGAGGSVGGFAVQLACTTGARVIGLARAARHIQVRALGATDVVDHHTEDIAARVRQLTNGRGVDAVIDVVSSSSATEKTALLVHGGGIACIEGTPTAGAVQPFTTAPSIHEIALGAAHAYGDDKARLRLGTMLENLLDRVATGTLDPLLNGVVDLVDAPGALAHVAAGRTRGKIVVSIR